MTWYGGLVSTVVGPDSKVFRDPAFPLCGATIVVGVTGGIAAYKAAELVRLLDKAGATVEVAMTPNAQRFVSAMTFQALTRRTVFTDMFSLAEESSNSVAQPPELGGGSIGHVQLADRADLVVIAPATANCIARLAAGLADDTVLAIALATRAPIVVAPAMNIHMWNHPLTQRNLKILVDVATYHIVAPGDGYLACGWTGPGRLAEPTDIVEAAAFVLTKHDLAGANVVVTAGPTHEAIDPVRFIGNRSSGKMGVAIAAAAQRRGARVRLVLGPSDVLPPNGVTVDRVETALQMQRALDAVAHDADVIVMTAAVADYRPAQAAGEKRKRSAVGRSWSLELVENPDLLANLGRQRTQSAPLLVGFAAETEDVFDNARAKLAAKGCDLIVANNVAEPGAGFGVDTNHIALVDAEGVTDLPPGSKAELAHRILDRVVAMRR